MIVYILPVPDGFRVAASVAVRLPVIWISPAATDSFAVIEMILLTGSVSQLSEAVTLTVMGTSWWFGGESTFGFATRDWSSGGVVSAIVKATFAVELFPAASVTVTMMVYGP